jgi:hypothetical protein
VPAGQDGLAVGDEHPLDRQVEERAEPGLEALVRLALLEPRPGAEAERAAQDDVADRQRVLLRQPEDDLCEAARLERLDSAGEPVAGLELVARPAGPVGDPAAGRRSRPETRAVALDDRPRVAGSQNTVRSTWTSRPAASASTGSQSVTSGSIRTRSPPASRASEATSFFQVSW